MRFLGDDHFAQPALQGALVPFANTRRGRAKLCIRGDVPKNRSIISMHRNRYTWITNQKYRGLRGAMRQLHEQGDGPISLTTDFRCRSKFAYRLHALHSEGRLPFDARVGWAETARRRKLLHIPGLSIREAHALSSPATFYPDPSPEVTSVDGYARMWVLAGRAWAAMRDGAGNHHKDDNATGFLGHIRADGNTDEWDSVGRSFWLFDTSSLGASAAVSAATLSVQRKTGSLLTLAASPTYNVFAADPASNTAIVDADFTAVSRDAFSTAIAYAATANNTYSDWVLNSLGRAAIDVSGVSKYSIQDVPYDVGNVEPTWSASDSAYILTHNAETSGTASDPKLEVTFTIGPAGYAALSGIGR